MLLMKYQDPSVTETDLMEDFIIRPHPYLLVGVLEEVGAERRKDSKNPGFSMEILRASQRKVPIGKASGKF